MGTMNTSLETVHDLEGPWSLATSKRFWEGFAPSALAAQEEDASIHAVFLSERTGDGSTSSSRNRMMRRK